LASVSGLHFAKEPGWALQLLSLLQPKSKRSGTALLEALGQLAQDHASLLDPDLVARCLAHTAGLGLTEDLDEDHHFQSLSEKFPRQLYEHLRNLLDHPIGEDSAFGFPMRFANSIPLGPIVDPDYLAREIQGQWRKVLSANASEANGRLVLLRSLIWSDAASAPERIRKLIDCCQDGGQLRLAAGAAMPQTSGFVFASPDLVRTLLTRAREFGVCAAIEQTLRFSAFGVIRDFTGSETDPEHRYILDRALDLANRYQNDPVLHHFYRMIVDSERLGKEHYRQLFQHEKEEGGWA
jgi:hypothetical protein